MNESLFKVDISSNMVDLSALARQIAQANFDKPMQEGAKKVAENAKRRIRTRQSVFGGRYKNLTDKTIADKRREHSRYVMTPLRRTGAMYRAITYGKIRKNLWQVFVRAPQDQKAYIHTVAALGMKNLPARQFMVPGYITSTERKWIGARVKRYAKNVILRALGRRSTKKLY